MKIYRLLPSPWFSFSYTKVGDPFHSSWGSGQTPSPRGLQTSLFPVAAFWVFLCILPQGCDFEGWPCKVCQVRVPSPWEPRPCSPRRVQPRGKAGSFLRKSLLRERWISFKKAAHVFSRTGFIVFVIVLYPFRSSSVKTLHTLTFPAARDVSSTLIQAFYYFFPLRMAINYGSPQLLCWVQSSRLAYRCLKSVC